jgi:imidazolonepropionase-like amidohydrolase
MTGALACAGSITAAAVAPSGRMQAPQPITIRAARVLDGRGGVVPRGVVEVRGPLIAGIDQRDGRVTYDLGDATLLPGLIDVHVHIDWFFGPGGTFRERDVTAAFAADAVLDNARKTLLAGFTTVQSLGSPWDKPLREAIEAGVVVGPRLLSSLGQIHPGKQTPAQLRHLVRELKAQGADAVKVFASGASRQGGAQATAQDQLDAVCGEANALGLRTLVHAQEREAIVASVRAGCSQIEHGWLADDAAIDAMRMANVFFDPNIGLVLQNYLENRNRFLASHSSQDFAEIEQMVPMLAPLFKKARKAGLRMPLGTDAVAGAHGQNAREAIARVRDGGEPPMEVIIAATSLAAESLGRGGSLGTLGPGYVADIVAVAGDPVQRIERLRDVKFVMKGGRVYRRP